MPQVSVIIPTHNRAEMLREAIKSVLDQTFTDFEIIVVDDHSTDHTRDVVNKVGDARIVYLRNEGKNGPSIARNVAIKNAVGNFIAFLDDDDEWMSDKLEKQINILSSCPDQICGIYSNRLMIDKQNGRTFSDDPGAEKLKGNLLSQLMVKNPIHTSTLVVKKGCLDEVGGFDETMRYMEDRDLWIRLSKYWDFEYIDEPLTKAYYHGNEHLSRNLIGQTHGREVLLHRYQDLLKKDPKSWGRLYVSLGAQYCQLRDMKKGRRNLLKGMRIYPASKMALFHFFASLFGSTVYRKIRSHYNKLGMG